MHFLAGDTTVSCSFTPVTILDFWILKQTLEFLVYSKNCRTLSMSWWVACPVWFFLESQAE